MNFQVGFAITCDRWPNADIGDTRPGLAVDVDADQVDPGQWHTTTLELHIGRRRTQLARQLLPMQDPPGNPERTTEQALGQGEISGRQGITHLGTADTQTLEFNRLCGFNRKPVNLPGLLQEIEIPYPVTAETEVVTDLKMLYAQAVDQDGLDELGGAELAQPLVKGQA
ncbi:hypothetical protein D3C85_1227710 [compost metagenome]